MVDVMGMGEISGDETEILGGLLDGQKTKRNLKSRIASEGGGRTCFQSQENFRESSLSKATQMEESEVKK